MKKDLLHEMLDNLQHDDCSSLSSDSGKYL